MRFPEHSDIAGHLAEFTALTRALLPEMEVSIVPASGRQATLEDTAAQVEKAFDSLWTASSPITP